MTHKQLKFAGEAREKSIARRQRLADAVRVTLGIEIPRPLPLRQERQRS